MLISLILVTLLSGATLDDVDTPSRPAITATHPLEDVLVALTTFVHQAEDFAVCASNPWVVEGARPGLDPMLIYSMALTESRTLWRDGYVRPCPWCIRIDGELHRATSKDEAQALARAAMSAGRTITDVGVMQVNARAHAKRVDGDIAALVDVSTNIRVGADILQEALASTKDFERGLGRYHSWTARLGDPYGRVALRRYTNLIKHTGGSLWPTCTKYVSSASTTNFAS